MTQPPPEILEEPSRTLTFAPLAWLKLQYFCHAGDTEIGGFGISSSEDPLYVRDFVTVCQRASLVTVHFDDTAVADFFDGCLDQGLVHGQFDRIWLHTHPGESVIPSSTDEDTFARVFGRSHWSVLFILGRTGRTYARLAFSVGPGAHLLLPVQVDWSSWPEVLADNETTLPTILEQWRQEYTNNIQPTSLPLAPLVPMDEAHRHWQPSAWDTLPWEPEVDEVRYELIEKGRDDEPSL